MANSLLDVKSILIDTCFLLDSFSQPKKFSPFILSLRQKEIDFLTLDLIKVEFIRSQSSEALTNKLTYYKQLIGGTLPINESITQLMIGVIEEYANDLPGVSIVDLYLAATLKQYRKLHLLTSNHKDFPTRIFTRHSIYNFELVKSIYTYALYSYRPKDKEINTSIPF